MIDTSLVLSTVAGLILLFTGRRIFWLAAALAAFLFTYRFVEDAFGPGLYGIVAAAVVGLLLAWLAIRFIKGVGYLVGALAGAAAMPYLLGLFGVQLEWWIMALIGAAVGVLIITIAFDWGLVLVTSWLGANVVSDNAAQVFDLGGAIITILFVVLLVVGIGSQAGLLRQEK